MSLFVINPYVFGAGAEPDPDPRPDPISDPSELTGLRLWLDAADAGTITDAGAGAVSQWVSKDPNSRVFSQASSGLRPTTGAASMNGENVLSFAEDYLVSADAASVWKFMSDGTPHTIFVVAELGETGGINAVLGTNGNTNNKVGMLFTLDDRGSGTFGAADNGFFHTVTNAGGSGNDAVRNLVNNEVNDDTPYLFTIASHPAAPLATPRSAASVLGGQFFTESDKATAASSSNPTHTLQVGSDGAGTSGPYTGSIAEVIVVEGVISVQDRRAIEAYLATKWGLTLAAPSVASARMVTVMNDSNHNGFPGLTITDSGRHLVAYRSSTGHSTGDGVIKLQYSDDSGVTWSGATTIYSETGEDVRDAALATLSDGTIVLSCFVSGLGVRILTSDDDGATWSSPATLTATSPISIAGRSSAPVVELSNGDLLMPIYGSNAAVVQRSNDRGASWGNQVTIVGVDSTKGWAEPYIVRLANGDLLCGIRADNENKIYLSKSMDGGATWGTPVEAFAGDSRPALVRAPGDWILCAYRSGQVYVRVSTDGGDTWGDATKLLNNLGAYVQMVVADDGIVHYAAASEVSSSNADVLAGVLS